MNYVFTLPTDDEFPTIVLYIPVSEINLSGISVVSGNVRIQQNDGVVSVPASAVIIFPVLGNEEEHLAMVVSRDDDDFEFIMIEHMPYA